MIFHIDGVLIIGRISQIIRVGGILSAKIVKNLQVCKNNHIFLVIQRVACYAVDGSMSAVMFGVPCLLTRLSYVYPTYILRICYVYHT